MNVWLWLSIFGASGEDKNIEFAAENVKMSKTVLRNVNATEEVKDVFS